MARAPVPHISGRAAVPSGASTGEHEANELRDRDPKRYLGKGVRKTVQNVEKLIPPELIGLDVTEQVAHHRYLGGPMARTLPVPMMNILNGGAHATNTVDFQAYMIVPVGAESVSEALRMVIEAIEAADYEHGTLIAVALDCAASELLTNGKYTFKKSGAGTKSADQMGEMYAKWLQKYPIVSIEDGLAESDWTGWGVHTEKLGTGASWSATTSS